MISRRTGTAIAATLALHAALMVLFASSVLQQQPSPPELPAVVVQLIQPAALPSAPKPLPPPPKPLPPPPKPVTQPTPIAPAPAPTLAPTPAPAPSPSPAPAPKPTAPAAPVAVAPAPVVPAAPAPPPVVHAAPAPTAKTDVTISASYGASNEKPKYPMMSKRLGEQGTVVLRVLVKSDGSAGTVEVKISSNVERLDRAAVEAVSKWRFIPATSDGKPIDEWYQVPIPFKLQN